MTINCRIKGQLTQIRISWGITPNTIEVRVGWQCLLFDRSTPLAEMIKTLEEEL